METLLLVDDNEQMVLLLKAYLENSGYKIITAENGKEGLEQLKKNIDSITMVIIDYQMPEMDGPTMCQVIRNDLKLNTLPIIMMTALKGIDDKVTGYSSGVDDYLVKPFEPVELVLKIKSQFNRRDHYQGEVKPQKQQPATALIEVDRGAFSVTVKGMKVNLSPIEFDLFNYLYENANNYVSPDRLLEEVFHYPPGTGSPENIRTHIRNLRVKLEEDPKNPKIITSLIKRGYMLNTSF